MYFDFEDYHPDISPVGHAISWREGVLLSIIAHLVMVILILVAPQWFPWLTEPRRAQVVARQQPQRTAAAVRVRAAARRPAGAEAAGARRCRRTRIAGAAAPERAKKPENLLPFSRGNTPERVDEPPREVARGQGPQPDPAAGRPAENAAAGSIAEAPGVAVGAAAAVQPHAVAERRERPLADVGRIARRRAAQPAALRAERSRSTTRAAAAVSSAPRFSSTPRASSSARGSGASSRR